MTVKLKFVLLIQMAILAATAVTPAAPVAQAAPELTGQEGGEVTETETKVPIHATIDGVSVVESVLTVGAFILKCKDTNYSGTLASGQSSEMALTPSYSECLASSTWSTHLFMNGCDYLLHAGEQVESDLHEGTADIVCPEGKEIDIEITTLGGAKKCTLQVPAQVGLGPVRYTDKTSATPDDLEIDFNLIEIHYKSVGTEANCGNVKEGTHEGAAGATYEDISTGQATDATKKTIPVEVNPSTHKFAATGTEVDIGNSGTHVHTIFDGEQREGTLDVFGAGTIAFRCESASFPGTDDNGTGTTLTVEPNYGFESTNDCKSGFTFVTHIDTNGCHYLYNIGSKISAGTYNGSVDIVCPEGESIDLLITTLGGATKCTIQYSSQAGLGPIVFHNEVNTPSSTNDVLIEWDVTGIEYKTTGTSTNCGGKPTGTYHDATYTGEHTVQGANTNEEFIDVEVSG